MIKKMYTKGNSTARQYGWNVEMGDGHRPYDDLDGTTDKFDLFAGWLLGDAAAGVPGHTTDKDLNGFRSAINRYMSDHDRGRPFRDNPEITATIKSYRSLMLKSKNARGIDSDLHWVPCLEPVCICFPCHFVT